LVRCQRFKDSSIVARWLPQAGARASIGLSGVSVGVRLSLMRVHERDILRSADRMLHLAIARHFYSLAEDEISRIGAAKSIGTTGSA
jgi:hypothetical protein